jgi:REP element-mobilizing transposase RayT
MPTRDPIFYQGGYYHIYTRGTEKRTIFQDAADKQRFLKRLATYKKQHLITILAFCLMPNHYHLLVRQNTEQPISVFLQKLNVSYSMYFNKRYQRVGPLFQGRFKAKLIGTDEYLLHISRYIHLNPLELIPSIDLLKEYRWSSLPAYLVGKEDDLVNSSIILAYFSKSNPSQDYHEFVKDEAQNKFLENITDILLE